MDFLENRTYFMDTKKNQQGSYRSVEGRKETFVYLKQLKYFGHVKRHNCMKKLIA